MTKDHNCFVPQTNSSEEMFKLIKQSNSRSVKWKFESQHHVSFQGVTYRFDILNFFVLWEDNLPFQHSTFQVVRKH